MKTNFIIKLLTVKILKDIITTEITKEGDKNNERKIKETKWYYFNCTSNHNCTKLLVPRNGTNEIKRYNKLKI